MTNWKRIYEKLDEANLNPYPVGIHKGVCTEPYCVIREMGQIPNIQTRRLGQGIIDIIVFVPYTNYTDLEPYKKKIIETLSDLDHIKRTGFETISTIDEDRKATTTSIEYVVLRKVD